MILKGNEIQDNCQVRSVHLVLIPAVVVPVTRFGHQTFYCSMVFLHSHPFVWRLNPSSDSHGSIDFLRQSDLHLCSTFPTCIISGWKTRWHHQLNEKNKPKILVGDQTFVWPACKPVIRFKVLLAPLKTTAAEATTSWHLDNAGSGLPLTEQS